MPELRATDIRQLIDIITEYVGGEMEVDNHGDFLVVRQYMDGGRYLYEYWYHGGVENVVIDVFRNGDDLKEIVKRVALLHNVQRKIKEFVAQCPQSRSLRCSLHSTESPQTEGS
jgi:hypothetical protein